MVCPGLLLRYLQGTERDDCWAGGCHQWLSSQKCSSRCDDKHTEVSSVQQIFICHLPYAGSSATCWWKREEERARSREAGPWQMGSVTGCRLDVSTVWRWVGNAELVGWGRKMYISVGWAFQLEESGVWPDWSPHPLPCQRGHPKWWCPLWPVFPLS